MGLIIRRLVPPLIVQYIIYTAADLLGYGRFKFAGIAIVWGVCAILEFRNKHIYHSFALLGVASTNIYLFLSGSIWIATAIGVISLAIYSFLLERDHRQMVDLTGYQLIGKAKLQLRDGPVVILTTRGEPVASTFVVYFTLAKQSDLEQEVYQYSPGQLWGIREAAQILATKHPSWPTGHKPLITFQTESSVSVVPIPPAYN